MSAMQNHEKPECRESAVWITRRLMEARTVLLSGEINDSTATDIIGQLLVMNAQSAEKPITIIINTGGGTISAGFAIYDVVRYLKAPVRTLGAGLIASMGVTLFLAPPRERRFSLPNSRFMIHQPLISGTIVGPASDLEINAREMIKLKGRLDRLISDATGQPLEKVEKDTQRDFWMNAEEAVTYGIVGRIIRNEAEMELPP